MPTKGSLLEMLLSALTQRLGNRLQRLYYKTIEQTGQHKREILVTRVELARDSLEEAKTQFQTALEKFSELTAFEGGNLESLYRQLKVEYDYSRSRAALVEDRIADIESVAKALFREWDEELSEYSNRTLRSSSRQKLKITQQHYLHLIQAMRRAEGKINPVLRVFHDQVLFIKHNLNAHAIASLEHELATMSIGVAGLIGAMEQSITRANQFVESLNGQPLRALPPGPSRLR